MANRLCLSDSPSNLTGNVRIDLFGSRSLPVGKRGKARTVACGWQGWNSDATMEYRMSRLQGSGSFYWPGALSAYVAVRRIMASDPSIHQAKIESISGREIARVYRAEVSNG